MKKYFLIALQIIHISFLVLITVTYTIFIQTSESFDKNVKKLTIIVIIAGVAWSSLISVTGIVYGSKEKVIQKLRIAFRKLLTKYWFLILSNFVFIAIQGLLFYQLCFYRQIAFTSPEDVELILNDKFGETKSIGMISSGSTKKFRLRVGLRNIAIKRINSKNIDALAPIDVQPWWSDKTYEIIKIPAEENYEKL